MFKPKEEYCTFKKEVVDPLKEDEPCFKLRKGLPLIGEEAPDAYKRS
jgi:hypothetical protein